MTLPPTHRWLRIEQTGVAVDVLVNDIPVQFLRPKAQSPFLVMVDEYLLPGVNEVSVVVHPHPVTSRALVDWHETDAGKAYRRDDDADVVVSVERYTADDHPVLNPTTPATAARWRGRVRRG